MDIYAHDHVIPEVSEVRTRFLMPLLDQGSRRLEPGLYTVVDVRWGMALTLSTLDQRTLIAFWLHQGENQQNQQVIVAARLLPPTMMLCHHT